MKFVKRMLARIKCKIEDPIGVKEWHKHYCTNDCNTCGYNNKKVNI